MLTGKVMQVDQSSRTGTIRDIRGRDYFFRADDCKDEQLPALYAEVAFEKDPDFKSTNVACYVSVLRLPSRV